MKIKVRVRLENHPDIAKYIRTTLALQHAAVRARSEQLVVQEAVELPIREGDADDLVAA